MFVHILTFIGLKKYNINVKFKIYRTIFRSTKRLRSEIINVQLKALRKIGR